MDEDAAVGAVGDGVPGDGEAGRADRIDAGLGRAGNRRALDTPADAFEGDAVSAAADDLAIVDDGVADATEVDDALSMIAEPAVGAVDHQPGQLDMGCILGDHQMAVAAIDDACGARHAGKPHISRQRQVRHDIGAGRQENRRVAVGRLLQHFRETPCSGRRARRAARRDRRRRSSRAWRQARCRTIRPQAACRAAPRPPAAKPAVAARKPRLFNIGTGFLRHSTDVAGNVPGRAAAVALSYAVEGLSSRDEQSLHPRRRQRQRDLPTSASVRSARTAIW